MADLDFNSIADKWLPRWDKEKLHTVTVDYSQPKYYITTAYPYMSGLLHVGHLFTYIVPEVLARFKRLQGHNVLFKWGFHCTGLPLISAAKKVREGDQKQLAIMKQLGIPEDQLPKFEKPEYWAEYFSQETMKDVRRSGFSMDPKYTFMTTSLNPPYDAFIKWQFNKLKEKGFLKKGKHPVVWCKKDESPIGDHARSEGEGETPQEMVLLKFKYEDMFLIAATLRPETIYGQTNLWVSPDIEYVKAVITAPSLPVAETWIMSRECAEKLKDQEKSVSITGTIKGSTLIGKKAMSLAVDKELIILPSAFCKPGKGSGVVTSVPSDAPDDWMGLVDLKNDPDCCGPFGLDPAVLKELEPIPIIDTPELGDLPAVTVCEDMQVNSQKDRQKLEKAKKLVYKKGFYAGVLKENCGLYANMSVSEAKEKVKQDLLKTHKAALLYELTGPVVCRCGEPGIVKIVSDQWFIEYNDTEWKKLTKKALQKLYLIPEKVRPQFEYVIDWLREWACARHFGLGTRLPWDERWVIESLSDSTLQMAYCTIARYLQHPEEFGFPVDKLNDGFFDFVFLGKGDIKEIARTTEIPEEMITRMKSDFEYWYPFDMRTSAKDLIQNHLTFSLFNHTAIFSEEYWPQAYQINGRVLVNNEKMSKSKGNFFTMRELADKHGPDLTRITAAHAVEGIDDSNFDLSFTETAKKKLEEFFTFAVEHHGKGDDVWQPIDDWLASEYHQLLKEITECMEQLSFRSALTKIFFDMQRLLKWYDRRRNNTWNNVLLSKIVESMTIMLSPFVPFFAHELWEALGHETYVAKESWPETNEEKIDEETSVRETLIRTTMSDIQSVFKLSKIEEPQKLTLFTAAPWKYSFVRLLKEVMQETMNPREVLTRIMQEDEYKKHGQFVSKTVMRFVKARTIPAAVDYDVETGALQEAATFYKKEYGVDVQVISEIDSANTKAAQAMPGKVAILVE